MRDVAPKQQLVWTPNADASYIKGVPVVSLSRVLCQGLDSGLSIIPAQAGVRFPGLDPRLRGNDELDIPRAQE